MLACLKIMNIKAVIALLQQQQKELAEQRPLFESRSRKIATLSLELDSLRKPHESNKEKEITETLVSESKENTWNIASDVSGTTSSMLITVSPTWISL